MKPLKLVITFCAAVFITTGVFASSNPAHSETFISDSISIENPKVSAANAVSLFNFMTIADVKKDSNEAHFYFNDSFTKSQCTNRR